MAQIRDYRSLQVLWSPLERKKSHTFQRGDHSYVVQVIASQESEASSNMGTYEQAGKEVVTEPFYLSSLSAGTYARQNLKQEPSALAVHAGICTGGAG